MLVNVTIDRAITQRLRDWPGKLEKDESIIRAGADVIRDAARENVVEKLYRESTGFLESEIVTHVNNPLSAEVGTRPNRAPHAAVHEFGATIRPRRAAALFVPIRRGVRPNQQGLVRGVDFVLAQQVVIPQRAYLRPALDEKRGEAIAAIGQEIVKKL